MRKLDSSNVASGIRQIQVLRIIIGLIGILLPTSMLLVDWLFLAGNLHARGSVSAYYYSGMRDVLVGCLVTVGFFLITYRILERHLENFTSIVAGASAILVAVLPTKRPPGISIDATDLQKYFGEQRISNIHLAAAITFVACLVFISLLFGLREFGVLRVVLLICTGLMVLSLLLSIALFFFVDYYLLVGEIGALIFFGVSWLIKGACQ
jgi:hypothetical protein